MTSSSLGFSIIAHLREVQQIMDLKRIPWGIQYEIACGVCTNHWDWSDITAEKLDNLKRSNREDMPHIEHVMLRTKAQKSEQIASLPLWYASMADVPFDI